KLVGVIKVMLDGYREDRFDRLLIFYTKFINTMKQEPVMEQLLPLSGEKLGVPEGAWDYIYEPEAKVVLDQVLTRYIETLIYQAVAENMASEQSARMVAMKADSDSAESLIDELTLVYNKNRQANITKELSEIVGGAAAVEGSTAETPRPRERIGDSRKRLWHRNRHKAPSFNASARSPTSSFRARRCPGALTRSRSRTRRN